MKHETEEWRGKQYPAPGKWSINWVEGGVISWRHDPDPDARIHDGPTAHVFAIFDDDGTAPSHRVEVDGDTVGHIEGEANRTELMNRIGDLLADHAPDS